MNGEKPRARWILLGVIGLLLALGVARWLSSSDASEDHSDEQRRGDVRVSVGDARPKPRRVELGAESRATLVGTVRTRGGGPIAGAQVCAWPSGEQLRGLGDGKPRCTKTEHDGHYRLEGLWPVGTNAVASAAEHQSQQWMRPGARSGLRSYLDLRPGEVREGVDFELAPGGTKVSGVVKDISGGEIEGAMVMATQEFFWTIGVVAWTDADGRFEMWTKPGELSIVGEAEGYARAWTTVFSPSASVELFLTPESILVGRVVHAQTGEPVPDVTVWTETRRWVESSATTVRSDAEGQFRIGGLHPGSFKVLARSDTFYGESEAKIHLGLGQTSDLVEVRVHPVAFVEGRIVNAGTDLGCDEGSVTLTESTTNEEFRGRTEREGLVVIRGVLPGTYRVAVSCTDRVAEASYPEVVVGSESLIDLVWEVREGQAIRGEIVDANGEPVPEMQVSAQMLVDASNARGQTTSAWGGESGLDGTFELAGLLPGRYQLYVWGDVPSPEQPITVEVPEGADLDGVRVELPATGKVRGRVIDEAGVVQVGVTVSVKTVGSWNNQTSVTDDQGEFTIENAPIGEVRVSVVTDRWGASLRRPGSNDDDIQGEPATVRANAIVEVELVIERRDGIIRGVVLDETGSPVDDAFVTASRMTDSATASEGSARAQARWGSGQEPKLTDADGTFTIDGLSPGTYVVRADRKGGGEAVAEGVEIGSSVELTLASTGVLAGVVTIVGGTPPERVSISATDQAQGVSSSDKFFRTEGRWVLRQLPAGKYKVVADTSAGGVELEVELAEGQRIEDLELVLQPRVTLRGRLVDHSTRAPVPGMRVWANRAGTSFSLNFDDAGERKYVSDAEGRFEVDRVPTGRIMLLILPRNFTDSNDYEGLSIGRTLPAEPVIQDIGDIVMISRRMAQNEKPGDLGFELRNLEPDTDPEQVQLTVALVRPGGPAEASGLAVGDVIESVDGKSVVGLDSNYFYPLIRVAPGTSVELGLAGGKTVTITAGAPSK